LDNINKEKRMDLVNIEKMMGLFIKGNGKMDKLRTMVY
jgi:hypothetical protein